MAKKTERIQPYYLENIEDESLVEFVAGAAGLLSPGFVLDMREVDGTSEEPAPNARVRTTRIGKDQGLEISYHQELNAGGSNITSAGIKITTFGLATGTMAALRYEAMWEEGNRSYLELEVDGPEGEVDRIIEVFHRKFPVPSDRELGKLKKEMRAALGRQEWGATEDIAQMVLLWRPEDTDALEALCSACSLTRDTDRAERFAHRILQLKPDSHSAYLNLGNVWMNRGDYDKAIEQYSKVMELQSDQDYAPYIVASVYEQKGDATRAVELYRKALSLKKSGGPTNYHELAKEALARLGSL